MVTVWAVLCLEDHRFENQVKKPEAAACVPLLRA